MDRRCTSFSPKAVTRCSVFLGRSKDAQPKPRDNVNRLYGSTQDKEDELEESVGPSLRTTTGRTPWKPPRFILLILDIVSMIFSYTITFLGALLSLGLVLNLCGYAYTFSLTDGIRIETIQQMRLEIQFENEIRRISRDDYRSTMPR